MKYELRYLSFGETLGQTFNLYFDNFIPLIVISFVSTLPGFVFAHFVKFSEVGDPSLSQILALILFFVLFVGIYMLCSALMIELISKKYLKQHQGVGQYIGNVMPLIFPIIGLSILSVIIVGGPAVVLFSIAGPKAGVLLYIIPGIYLMIGVMLASQVLIVERKKVIESVKRSFFLTKSSKLEIFGFLIIIGLLKRLVIDKLLVEGLIFRLIRGMEATFGTKILVAQGVYYLVEILFNPITACLFILVYFNLRIEKEGFDLEHLVDQFGTSLPLTSTNDQ